MQCDNLFPFMYNEYALKLQFTKYTCSTKLNLFSLENCATPKTFARGMSIKTNISDF